MHLLYHGNGRDKNVTNTPQYATSKNLAHYYAGSSACGRPVSVTGLRHDSPLAHPGPAAASRRCRIVSAPMLAHRGAPITTQASQREKQNARRCARACGQTPPSGRTKWKSAEKNTGQTIDLLAVTNGILMACASPLGGNLCHGADNEALLVAAELDDDRQYLVPRA